MVNSSDVQADVTCVFLKKIKINTVVRSVPVLPGCTLEHVVVLRLVLLVLLNLNKLIN